MSSTPEKCPCGSGSSYTTCCEPFIQGTAKAPTAEKLMRSRYCAFVLLDSDYLLATWHPEHCPADLRIDPATRWLGLEVRHRKQVDATHAEVEFVARCREPTGRAARIHERSRFVRENGRWFYLDGEML